MVARSASSSVVRATSCPNALGLIELPPILDPVLHYCAVVRAADVAPVRSPWFTGDEWRNGVDLAVERTRSLQGRLLDAWGNVVRGAPIHLYGTDRSTSTDADGRFHLEGVAPRGRLAVDRDRGRRAGTVFGAEAAVEWRLPAASHGVVLPRASIGRERRRELAAELFRSVWTRAMAQGSDRDRLDAWQGLAAVDPAGTAQLLRDGNVPAKFRDSVIRALALAIAAEDPDETIALLAEIPSSRLVAYTLARSPNRLRSNLRWRGTSSPRRGRGLGRWRRRRTGC